MEQAKQRRLHVAYATDWINAVITILEPGSPHRPWQHEALDAQSGDAVVFVLGTDPPSILTEVVEVGADGDLGSAVFDRAMTHATLMDLATVAAMVGMPTTMANSWSFGGEDAEKLESVLDECRYISAPATRFGHTSVAAARILLRFWGDCDGCGRAIDLTAPDAKAQLFVHTVDPHRPPAPDDGRSGPEDWPAVMCRKCFDRMARMGYTNFVAFKFALHPPCPECDAHQTRATFYGMPSEHWNIEPWSQAGGCCPGPEKWCCSVCYHDW